MDPIGIEPTAFALRSSPDESPDAREITGKQAETQRQKLLQLTAGQRVKLQVIARVLGLLGDTDATSSSDSGASSKTKEEEAMHSSRDKPEK